MDDRLKRILMFIWDNIVQLFAAMWIVWWAYALISLHGTITGPSEVTTREIIECFLCVAVIPMRIGYIWGRKR